MTTALTYRALAALPPALQAMARQHVQHRPTDDLSELVSELALALLELAERSTDPARIYSRARSRLRRATQDVAHYSVPLDTEHHDIERDDEQSGITRADIVREIAVPAPIIWTRFCNSGRLFHGISLTGFEG
jgi:hypothetical protein